MSDAIQSAILAAFSAALERAISQAVATHVEDLQTRLDHTINVLELRTQRIAALETKLTEAHIFTQTSTVTVYDLEMLKVRLAKLESAPTDAAHEAAGLDDELLKIKARLDELEATDARDLTKDQVREIAEAAAEEAIDAHCSDYDHDEYASHVDDGDKHSDEDSIESAVREALDGLSVTLSL